MKTIIQLILLFVILTTCVYKGQSLNERINKAYKTMENERIQKERLKQSLLLQKLENIKYEADVLKTNGYYKEAIAKYNTILKYNKMYPGAKEGKDFCTKMLKKKVKK